MEIKLRSGKFATFTLREPDPVPSSYFFSMERSGSSLFWTLTKDLLDVAKRAYCELLEDLFEQGIARVEIPIDTMRDLLKRTGYVFGVFRELDPAFEGLDVGENKKFLLIRDPRDMLVSLYYSMKGTHRVPAAGSARVAILKMQQLTSQPISDFMRSPPINGVIRRYKQYSDFCRRDKNVVLFRYEDVIFNKRNWALQLLKELNLAIPPERALKIADDHDILPEGERAEQNIRQVRPGDFRRHLDRATIAYIEEMFAANMAFFGYVPEETVPAAFTEHKEEFLRAVGGRLAALEEQLYQKAAEAKATRIALAAASREGHSG